MPAGSLLNFLDSVRFPLCDKSTPLLTSKRAFEIFRKTCHTLTFLKMGKTNLFQKKAPYWAGTCIRFEPNLHWSPLKRRRPKLVKITMKAGANVTLVEHEELIYPLASLVRF